AAGTFTPFAPGSFGTCPGNSPARSGKRCWACLSPVRFGTKVSQCKSFLAMAVRFSGSEAINRSPLQRHAQASHFGEESAKSRQSSHRARGDQKSGELSYLP